MPRLQIMDTTIRDGQQSLWATRMQIGDMLPILPKMDRVGYWAIEAWGGATFDSLPALSGREPLGASARHQGEHAQYAACHALARAEPRRLQALLQGDRASLYQRGAPQRRRGLPRLRRAERHPQRRGQRRGHQGVRRSVRGRHLLHDLAGAHAGLLLGIRPAAEGSGRPTPSPSRTWPACSRPIAPSAW